MAFGMQKWLDAQDEQNSEFIQEMDSLRQYARTPEQHEALDEIVEQAKEVSSRIRFRRMRSMMLKA
jgi:hypothetical protein